MNKEDILKILEGAKDKTGDVPMRLVRLAFKKLPEPCTDTISRQAAIETLDKRFDSIPMEQTAEILQLRKDLRELPPSQPEIIHCKDCKHSEHWYRDKARCFLWHEEGIDVFEDGFCNYAERRTDE